MNDDDDFDLGEDRHPTSRKRKASTFPMSLNPKQAASPPMLKRPRSWKKKRQRRRRDPMLRMLRTPPPLRRRKMSVTAARLPL